MLSKEEIEAFDFRRILLPDQLEWSFLWEVAFRTFFMFVLLLLFFKLTGKRSIYQLSLFELAVIIGLGSAAGDPMFYEDVGLLPILVVFLVISIMYKLLTWLTLKSEKVEQILEGTAQPLVLNDLMMYDILDSEILSYDEFFGFLRNNQVEHLGQVRAAYLEVTGNISIFYYSEDDIKPGLPILPEALKFTHTEIEATGNYSCVRCGFTNNFTQHQKPLCAVCGNHTWVRSVQGKRIT